MKWFKSLFAPKEVMAAIGILDELELKFPCPGFQLVRKQIESLVWGSPQEFAEVVRKSGSVRQWVLSAVSNVAGDMAESGEYHVHRGFLNPLGPGEDLLRVYDGCLDDAVRMGFAEPEWVAKQKAGLRKGIAEVG